MGLIIEAATPRPHAHANTLPSTWQGPARFIRTALLATLGLGLAGSARAQLIDELEVHREGADAVLAIHFVTPVQYQRSAQGRSGDESLVYYRVLPTRQRLELTTSERRLKARPGVNGGAGLPAVTVTDEPTPGNDIERRLQLRFSAPVKTRVRSGRDGRSIELLLQGRGAQVGLPVTVAEAPPPSAGAWRVTLQASRQAGSYLSAPIPAAMQDLNLFTTRRVEGGQTLYETHLGPFATRAEADSALRALGGRFPDAAVTGTGATMAAAPPTLAASPPSRLAAATVAAAGAPTPAHASTPPATPATGVSAVAPPTPAAASAPTVSAAATPPAAQPSTASTAAAPAALAAPAPVDTDLDRRAAAQLALARAALAGGDTAKAIDTLSALLDLPPNLSSRAAQALIGQARLKAGDTGRARAEFDAFLRLYPSGEDADRVRAAVAALSGGEVQTATATNPDGSRRRPSTTTLTGSIASTYYGGQSRVRTQEFQDSPIGGLPELVSDATLSAADQKQIVTSADVNWRQRDADVDQRFVFRDAYTKDILRSDKTRNRLTALYYDHRSFAWGTSVRLGRQSPLGGGVLGRFDGVQASYAFQPRWKVGVVAGEPTDTLLDTKRRFYGASIEAEALTPQLGASLYTIQQTIDGEVDRRAIGSEMRYFNGGLSANAQIDYDVLLKDLNVVSVQGTWQRPDNTVFNLLYDRRNAPLLALGNTLFFTDPNLPVRPTRISELLATTTLALLRQRAKDTTSVSTQAALGVTTPITPHWQLGADLRYTSTGAIAPVPDILPTGLPASGDIWSVNLQAIGTNLYSVRDTHVLIVNVVNGPSFTGRLLSYNNSSLVFETVQLEPSIKLYHQSDNSGTKSTRWSPGLRLTWRVVQHAALESEVNVERSKTTGPMRNESSTRALYYLGGRYDF